MGSAYTTLVLGVLLVSFVVLLREGLLPALARSITPRN